LQRTADVSCSLKQTTEGIWTRLSVFIGSWFHCGIVYGKNECLYVSLEVWICLYVRGCYFLDLVSENINMSDGTATRWNDTLYIITNLLYTWVHPRFFDGFRVAHLFSFLCCPIMALRSEFRVVMTVTISATTTKKEKKRNDVWLVFTSSYL